MSVFVPRLEINQRRRPRTVVIASLASAVIACGAATVQAQENISIESLLKGGWQIAGYTAPGDNRSSFILFRHPDHAYLVNCRVGYDVNRKPRSYSNCYALR